MQPAISARNSCNDVNLVLENDELDHVAYSHFEVRMDSNTPRLITYVVQSVTQMLHASRGFFLGLSSEHGAHKLDIKLAAKTLTQGAYQTM